MSLRINDTTGTIELYQGDSGSVFVNGLLPEKKYRVYFAVQDKNRNFIGEQLEELAENVSFVEFKLLSSFTLKLEVPKNKSSETYYYGVKVEEIGTNNVDTLFIANSDYGDLNELIVYPKKVKGS